MHPIVLMGFLAFFVASLTVGLRLVLLWWRTRQLPELLIGLGVLGIGPVGFGAMMGAHVWIDAGAGAAALGPKCLLAAGNAAVFTGVIAKCIFNWRVYHAGSPAVSRLVHAIAVVLVVHYLYKLAFVGFDVAAVHPLVNLAQSSLQAGCLLWGASEAFRYYLMMRRRALLGLADAVVTNRFLLWGIGAFAAGFGTLLGAVVSYATGVNSLQIPWLIVSSSAHGMVAALAMWLAFLPPSAYLRWIRGPVSAH